MVRLVSTIIRDVRGKVINPGEEFEVDEGSARVLVASGQATPTKKDAAPAAPASTPDVAKADAAAKADTTAKAAPAKSSTEVKPLTLQDANPAPNQGEYG